MSWYKRNLKDNLEHVLKMGKSILLFGPRQTGKTSLVKEFKYDRYINLMDYSLLRRYEANPAILIEEIKAIKKPEQPIIIIDEIQKVPSITDAIQLLIDDKIAQFILTGSSARKIKNLLPGRVIKFTMRPLSMQEYSDLQLDNILVNGCLPEIATMQHQADIDLQLDSYVSTYLEEEIRKEAIVRDIGAFGNFLQLACIESGNLVNFAAVSQEIGVSVYTITEYYNILQDCMLVERIDPLIKTNSRRRLTKSARYIIFDLGVRRAGATESASPNIKQKSILFEQFIGLELKKLILEKNIKAKLLFWRDHAGPEVDYIIEKNNKYIPIEVKWTDNPQKKDIRHLKTFRKEYPTSEYSFVVCRVDVARQLEDNIIAIPWQDLANVIL